MDNEQEQSTVPIFNHLDKIYTNINDALKMKHEPRYSSLKKRFQQLYGSAPQFYGRAPGRVNIIGEHIDYCGYSVLPAAIEQDFIMAYSIVGPDELGGDKIVLANIDSITYEKEELSTDPF